MLSDQPSGTEALKCPRCHSQDTKFCYYNNYSTAQPRYFCKTCKRYWTAGGSLRNVPVGGGLRKNKKSKLSKHVKEMLSTSPHEHFSPTPLLMASPSSSADGVVDESNVYRQLHPPWYDDSAAQTLVGGDVRPVATPQFYHVNGSDSAHVHSHSLAMEAHRKPNQSADCRFHQPKLGVDQAHSNSSEVSEGASEFSQANHNVPSTPQGGFPALVHVRYETENPVQSGSYTAFRGQGNAQCFVADHLSQEGKPRVKSMTEEEDEELGNVINVRYPYDWDQVSQVLFGGTPDFFQMPSF